jgi:hypothetical protein
MPPLAPGTIIFYWGSGLFSRLIELIGRGQPSHVQIVESVAPGGTVWIAESTVLAGVSGVQRHPLALRMAQYPAGTRVAAATVSPQVRLQSWDRLTPFVDACVGKVGYDFLGLAEFLEPEILREGQPNNRRMVCSAFVAAALEAVGLLVGVPYSQVSPQWLLEMRIFDSFIPLRGDPRPRNFNSV